MKALREHARLSWLAAPAAGWFVFFLLIPLAIVLVTSFATRGTYGDIRYEWTLANYLRASEWIYVRILWNSLKLASLTAVSCLLIGYPMAYVMATAAPRLRALLFMGVVVPFWTNFVVRTFALKLLLPEPGMIAVWAGMVTNYLPFMVLPLYVSLEKFDFTLLDAARDLGASPWSVFWRVLVPLTRPGIVTGLIFVFTPALGEFVIPDLLGGARTMLTGNLITEQFLRTRDWPFGSATSLLLILMTLVSLILYLRYQTKGDRA